MRTPPLLSLVVLPTALVLTRIPCALHAFPFCRFQSQQNLRVPEFECLRHIFGHKLGFAFNEAHSPRLVFKGSRSTKKSNGFLFEVTSVTSLTCRFKQIEYGIWRRAVVFEPRQISAAFPVDGRMIGAWCVGCDCEECSGTGQISPDQSVVHSVPHTPARADAFRQCRGGCSGCRRGPIDGIVSGSAKMCGLLRTANRGES